MNYISCVKYVIEFKKIPLQFLIFCYNLLSIPMYQKRFCNYQKSRNSLYETAYPSSIFKIYQVFIINTFHNNFQYFCRKFSRYLRQN